MPTYAMSNESAGENGLLKCRLCHQVFQFKNRRNFDERPKVLAPTVCALFIAEETYQSCLEEKKG